MRRAAPQARWRVALAGAVTGGLVLLAAAGCSDEQPPGESAPALAERLDKVDAAIEDGELGEARRAVDELVAETARALVADEITDDEADRIFDAAREVLAELPAPKEGDDE
ncbi:hypothetical protein D0Z08_07405 [Nocardioides immobilis]|uniref:Uncharacterized protein n=1 Tax=Nocardioides immobilis TaxID=2049295 RepID=A0A417Y4E0_9ACTN|nr:hypothetical protein [Nocardioides immobilis]RHW27509.1 hypothetical protein D0Z08_07405 [Nocardioides immobilis]